jgi:hypothetical protein
VATATTAPAAGALPGVHLATWGPWRRGAGRAPPANGVEDRVSVAQVVVLVLQRGQRHEAQRRERHQVARVMVEQAGESVAGPGEQAEPVEMARTASAPP